MNATLITGASSGIGEAFARKLAARGHNLLLVARTEEKLITLCNELGRSQRIRAEFVTMDLTEPDAPKRLFEETKRRDLQVEFLVNNAGFGSMGQFAELDLERELKMIDLNVRALVELTHLFLLPMREQERGTIINVASTAGFQPVPFMAVYAATKAFVLSFSEALWEENRRHGVHVMALCPGVTQTGFFEAAHMQRPPARTVQTPDEVVDIALRAVRRRKSSVVSGWTNFFMTESERLFSRKFILRTVGAIMRNHSQKG